MNPLIIIPARGGSKGLPGKNIKLLGGKPLINYTIKAARELFSENNIIISTDDIEIKEKIEETIGIKVPFLRPSELATDGSTTYDVLKHAINYSKKKGYDPNVIVLLQPTSPFRTSKHIQEAYEMFLKEDDIDMIASVKETKSNPYFVLFEENEKGFLKKSKNGNYTRRQDCPTVWEFNGAIYIINAESLEKGDFSTFKKIKKYKMNYKESIDIDEYADWVIAESYMTDED